MVVDGSRKSRRDAKCTRFPKFRGWGQATPDHPPLGYFYIIGVLVDCIINRPNFIPEIPMRIVEKMHNIVNVNRHTS